MTLNEGDKFIDEDGDEQVVGQITATDDDDETWDVVALNGKDYEVQYDFLSGEYTGSLIDPFTSD